MGGKSKSGSSGLEGIVFDDNHNSKPQAKKPNVDDIFGSGMLMPEKTNTSAKPQSTNPFDAFGVANNQHAQQNDPFASDVFSQNNAFGSSMGQPQNSGFRMGHQQNTGFGMDQSDWGSGFSNQFSGSGFQMNSGFSTSNTFSSQPAVKTEKKNEFASLNPFGGNTTNQQNTGGSSSKPSGAVLPPGVNGFDLFQ